jgi:hypothetical protein
MNNLIQVKTSYTKADIHYNFPYHVYNLTMQLPHSLSSQPRCKACYKASILFKVQLTMEASQLEDSGIVAFRLIVKLQWRLPFRL